MTPRFISYAQNFEDVMLWRALKNHPPGAYVDVGANDPVIDSVTKAFYDRGWRGINIDAVPEFAERLRMSRPEDANHGIFIGDCECITEFYQVENTGLSTYRKDYAESYRESGHKVSTIQVETKTLNSILEESGITNEQFHFLKVDVEGAEMGVLLGLDLERFRPWIAVVEATQPNARKLALEYEPLLLSHRYRYAYFDGLSRYYVAEERSELIEAFHSPPCVFDEYDRWETVQAREAIRMAEARAAELDHRLSESLEELGQVNEALENSRKLIASKDSLIHSLHAAMIQFEVRATRLHASFTKDFERAGGELSKALKKLYRSALWRRASWLTGLFSPKSPRAALDKAAEFITKSTTRHDLAFKKLREDMIQAIDAPAAQSPDRRRLGKSAAAIADLIQAGFAGNSSKP